jgi:hypothetical protein
MSRYAPLLFVVAALVSACAGPTEYVPHVVARGEVTLQYRGARFEAWAGGKELARGLGWRGLSAYVGCVPLAKWHAETAARDGRMALGFSIVGGILGGIGAAGLIGLADANHRWIWFGSGVGVAAVGFVFAGVGRLERNRANGHAVDAINYYNDAVGSLGATCADLTYPAPAGPAPN